MNMYWETISDHEWDGIKSVTCTTARRCPAIYFDMDGTLAKFNKDAPMEEVFSPGYFRSLSPNKEVLHLAHTLAKAGFEVCILSKACHSAIWEKHDWIRQHLPFIKKENIYFVPLEADKNNFVPVVKPMDVLIDDYWKNLTPDKWQGAAVKCVTDINTKDPSIPWVDLKAPPETNFRMVVWTMLRNFAAEARRGNVDLYSLFFVKRHVVEADCSPITRKEFYSICEGFGITADVFRDYGVISPQGNKANTPVCFQDVCAGYGMETSGADEPEIC